MTEPVTLHRDELLAAARGGDEIAFRELVEPHQRELHAHCYRMTASLDDADDMVQEVMLRAWRGLPRFEGRSSFRTWLYRIATNVCLTALEQRTRRILPVDRGQPNRPSDTREAPVAESVWIEPYPDEVLGVREGLADPEARYEQRESVELAFVAALQHLPANQRAALILREVLGFSAREVAEALDTTVAAVNSALQHARRTVQTRVPAKSQQATLRELGDERLRAIVDGYIAALERGDIEAIIDMLSTDATWSMPPVPEWYQGAAAIRRLIAGCPDNRASRYLRTRMNGQVAVASYGWDAGAGEYRGKVVEVLTLRGTEIASITAFVEPGDFDRFGLPAGLP